MKQRRIIASILVAIFLFTASVPVLASEINASPRANVGYLTLFATNDNGSSSAAGSLGHAFLSFKNISESYILIGVYNVAPKEEITLGTWPLLTANYHSGIWYNLESYQLHVHNKMGNRASLTIVLSQNDISTLNNIIATSDNYNLFSNNCVDFAIRVFSALSDYILSTGSPSSPNILKNSIMQFSEYESNRSIAPNYNTGYAQNGVFHYQDPDPDDDLAIVDQMEQNAIANITIGLIPEALGE